MRSKIIFYLMLVTLIFIVAILSYLSYNRFNTYTSIKENLNAITLYQKIGEGIEKLNAEEKYGALFLGTSGHKYADKLRESRLSFDSSKNELLKKLSEIKISKSQNVANNISKNLLEARTGIDTLSSDYDTVFNLTYHREISHPLIGTVKQQASSEVEGYMGSYYRILESIETISDEESFLLYILSKQKAMGDTEIKFWESIVSKNLFPALDTLPDKDLVNEISNTLQEAQEGKRIDNIRASVWIHSLDGKYSNNIEEIANFYDGMLEKLYRAKTLLYNTMNKNLEKKLSSAKRELTQYGLAMLLSILTLLLLLRVFGTAAREKKALESALRDMVSHLDKERQEELEAIIKRGDTVATYRFLASTTQEAHEARAQAIEAEKAKDLFLANMSHEIRTPLNGILGFTQLLESTSLDAEQEDFVDVVKTSSNNLLKIVNDILDLSKIKAEKMDLEYIPFNAIDTLNDALEPHETKASDKKIEYTTYCDPTLPYLVGDPTKLSQVMTNLIGNAMKFTDYQGEVNVEIRKVDETEERVTIHFSVKDNGLGISPEQKEHIFQEFSQADISTTREFGGTGLGLTITSSLVERMGGKLELESEVGKGSEFFFTLDFEKASGTEAQEYRLPELKVGYYKPEGTPRKIVELNLRSYLEEMNIDLEEFDRVDSEAIKGYDVIIVDYSFGETRERMEMLSGSAKQLIVLTHISYSDEARKMQQSVDSIIYKPLNISKITRALEKIGLDSKDATDEEVSGDDQETLSLEGARVLVVEDNVINQKLIGEIIESLGADIEIANNGREAVTLRQSTMYDMILMDIQMPILGGVEATQEILAWEKGNGVEHIPIIALTANALRGDREKYLQAGMDDYLSKPIDIENLKRVLGQYYSTPEMISCDTTDEAPLSGEVPEDIEMLSGDKAVSEEKSSFVNEEVLPVEELLEKESPVDVEESGVILIYTRNMLIYKIHKSSLEKLGYRVEYVDKIEHLVEAADQKEYSYILLDANLMTEDAHVVVESLSDLGMCPVLRGASHYSSSWNIANYTTVKELKEKILR
jgi:signal transduction histidine kinase/DNA-binding response OmpR family regulator